MGRNKDQGTYWETYNVKALKAIGKEVERLSEGGVYDKGDVHVWGIRGGTPKVALAWRRFWKVPGQKRRKTMHVVVLHHDDFLDLIKLSADPWVIECKASQAESVTTILAKATRKVEDNWE